MPPGRAGSPRVRRRGSSRPGAAILNDTLANDYRHWYPNFTHTPDRQHQVA